ncbi:hypothetical protein KVX96_06605 [Pseudoruegeria sp. SHC-113]|nr:hypothetical protein [Pseudoruegeria sp. SHC-113]
MLEIVTFRLTEGTSDAAFLTAASALRPFLAASSGFRNRRLTKGADGSWSDVIEWQDMATAQAAAARIMTEPGVAPFLSAIAEGSVTMRHETVQQAMSA